MIFKGRTVLVQDGNVEKALRKFKKKIEECGLMQELRERQEYIKPTTVRKMRSDQARRRWRKYLRGQELPRQLY